jgi:4'-phosphopantetheinyl transferase EntD
MGVSVRGGTCQIPNGEVSPLARIVPRTVCVADSRLDLGDQVLDALEVAATAGMVEARRREFVTGRTCARRALAALGHPGAVVLRGPRREPIWPAGLVGSITHCSGYYAAAVAHASSHAALGIDAEPNKPLPFSVGEIATGDEIRAIALLGGVDPRTAWDRLLFSIKESVFKAWSPLTGEWLDFGEVEVRLDARASRFAARLSASVVARAGREDLALMTGRWLLSGPLLVTVIALPPGP